MRESDLYPPLRAWLIANGYEVHVEIFGADVVAVKDGLITAIEMKTFFSQGLVQQLIERAKAFDYVVACTPGKVDGPHRLDFRNGFMQEWGFGFIIIDGDHAEQLIEPRRLDTCIESRRKYRLRKLKGRAPAMDHELAGLPSCRQLREQRLRRSKP